MTTAARRAVVTGGGRGIGRSIAAALTRAGHEVVVLGRTASTLEETVAAGDAAAWRAVDVADAESLGRSLEGLAVDILVNNAGIADSAPFARADLAFFRRGPQGGDESGAHREAKGVPRRRVVERQPPHMGVGPVFPELRVHPCPAYAHRAAVLRRPQFEIL